MALVESDYIVLTQGDKAPEFTLVGTDDKKYELDSNKGKALTLIVFMCNHCPYVLPKIKELVRIQETFKEKGLTVIGINSNEEENYPEDSFENMKVLVEEYGINFIYLRDDTQEIARAYGAVCTPDPFLFDKDLKLIFHSRIDDGRQHEGETKEMFTAVEEYLETKAITQEEIPSMGCSIKWL